MGKQLRSRLLLTDLLVGTLQYGLLLYRLYLLLLLHAKFSKIVIEHRVTEVQPSRYVEHSPIPQESRLPWLRSL